eukprot:evm.model.scf_484.8 EVM.evm.TU.scf_484.8   scf_484:76854-82042(-)
MANIAPLRLLRRTLMQRACRGLGVRGFAAEAALEDDQQLEVEVREYKGHKVEAPGNKVLTSKSELQSMFHQMYTMRRMEIASDQMYKAKFIRGFCHLYDGQEAICVGMEAATTKQDSVITSYRDHCQYVGRGGSVQAVMSELMGRTDGATKGVGGSMHMYKRDANFYGGNGIVGAQIPLGAGIAFTHKYNEDGSVCFTMYGDGAANQGQKYEAMNIAALWKLPVVFVCENNHYGMGTAIWRAAFVSDFYTRGDYVPGLKVDGMDALAVKHACAFAKEYVLENGPIILEMDTYRYHGHSMSDPGSTYRTRDEVNEFRKERDPIERIKKLLVDNEIATVTELNNVQRELKAAVDKSVEHAKSAPIPPNEWLWKNVYVEPLNIALRGVDSTSSNPVAYDPEYKL